MERVGQVLVETYRVERLMAEGGMASVYEAIRAVGDRPGLTIGLDAYLNL